MHRYYRPLTRVAPLLVATSALALGLSACGQDTLGTAAPVGGSEPSTMIVEQATKASAPDPAEGHQEHQLVLAAPAREDGKIWSGTVTYTASEPVEVLVLHGYNPTAADTVHGDSPNAVLPDGSKAAVTLMRIDSGTAVNSGSLSFAGSVLAFHNLDGKPFTITYTLAATAYAETDAATS